MENLKLLRKVKKLSQQKTQRELREKNLATSSIFGRLNFDDEIYSKTKEDHFKKLSDGLMLEIFQYIPRPTLIQYAQVSQRWNLLIQHEKLWRQFDLSNKTVYADVLIKLLNRGVKVFELARSEIRRSLKKSLNQNSSAKLSLSVQLDSYLKSSLKIEFLDLTNAVLDTMSINMILKHAVHLKKVSLESLDIDNQTFCFLGNSPSINTLNLSMCRGITVDGIILLLNKLKILKSLNVAWTNLDRESVTLLCEHLSPKMKKLNLSGCKTTLLDSDIQNLAASCPKLIHLDISDAQSLTNLSIEYIASNLSKLEHLVCSRCYSITPSSYFLLGELLNFTSLDIFNILNGKSFEILKENIPSLLNLNRFIFSSIARPVRPYQRTSSLWSNRLAEITLLENRNKNF